MSTKIRLGTRGSKLALTQSEDVADHLRGLGHDVELIILQTVGDVTTGSLKQVGGDGLFTGRLQTALLENEIDLAVHSLKDLPTEPVAGLKIGAVPVRENTQDALVLSASTPTQNIQSITALPEGFRIGTGSVRRKAQLLHIRPDLQIEDIRGNVDTRLSKLDAGQFDAIILACAGLNRLGLSSRISYACKPDEMAPAVGQGALGLEIRDNDPETAAAIHPLTDTPTFASVVAERKMLNVLCAGCLAPVGAISTFNNNELSLTGIVLAKDGTQRIVFQSTAAIDDAFSLGHKVADELICQGAATLIEQ